MTVLQMPSTLKKCVVHILLFVWNVWKTKCESEGCVYSVALIYFCSFSSPLSISWNFLNPISIMGDNRGSQLERI